MKEIKDDSDREIHHVSGVWNGRINTVKNAIGSFNTDFIEPVDW